MAEKFDDLTKDELLAVAEMFGVDEVRPAMSKGAIIKELHDMGVEFGRYKQLVALEAEAEPEVELALVDETPLEPVVVAEPVADVNDYIVVKMERNNVRYDCYGYRFTRENPFVLVKEDDADKIFTTEEGFRPASPRELKEYYAS